MPRGGQGAEMAAGLVSPGALAAADQDAGSKAGGEQGEGCRLGHVHRLADGNHLGERAARRDHGSRDAKVRRLR